MASNTKSTSVKRKNKHQKAGRRRKNKLARKSTATNAELFSALGASVLLAYVLMALLYNSLIHPFVILFSLPAAIGGAMFGLFAFGYVFSVFSMMGLILLVGLAIKNGILLVDRTNHNRQHGMTIREALLEAGPARLRPILMTSTTIALALSPTAFKIGEGSDFRAPLAAVVIGGVISSTLLTLLLVPVMYTLLEGLANRVQSLGGAIVHLRGRSASAGTRGLPPLTDTDRPTAPTGSNGHAAVPAAGAAAGPIDRATIGAGGPDGEQGPHARPAVGTGHEDVEPGRPATQPG